MEMTLEKAVTSAWASIERLSEENRISAQEMKDMRQELKEQAIEFRQLLKEQNAELERALKEQNAHVDANIADMASSVKELSKEVDRVSKEVEKTSKEVDRMSVEVEKTSKEINKWVGYFGNTIGTIIEMVIIPGIRSKMNEVGHNFTHLSAGKQFYYANGNELAEIDVFLENGVEVMAVEVKTRLSLKHVEQHVKRLERLREHESQTKITGLALLSAIAGLTIDEEAKEKASELGMYVIEVFEDEGRINVIKPRGELGEW